MSSKHLISPRKPKKRAYRPRNKNIICNEIDFDEARHTRHNKHGSLLNTNSINNIKYDENGLKPIKAHSDSRRTIGIGGHSRTLSYIKINKAMNNNNNKKNEALTPIKLEPTFTSPLPSPHSPNISIKKHNNNLLTFSAVTQNLSVSLPSSPINRNCNKNKHKLSKFNRKQIMKRDHHENIRVMVRFRPFNKTEHKYTERYLKSPFKSPGSRSLTSFSHQIQFFNDNRKIKMNYFCGSKKAKESRSNHRSYSFKFDKIFNETTKQKEIFNDVAKPICDDILQFKSSNATIFCYGQSGSGKTHTMFGVQNLIKRQFNAKRGKKHRRCTSERIVVGNNMGNTEKNKKIDIESMGIIGNSCCYIFDELKDIKDSLYNVYSEFTYNIYIECIEIYNEKLKDLLNSKQIPIIREIETKRHSKIITNGTVKKGPKIFRTEIQNITRKHVKSIKEILNILQISSLNRNISKTSLNETSSRSHMIMRLIIKTVNGDNNKKTESIINFVDLAGSENIRKTISKTNNNNKSTKNGNNSTPKTRKKQVKEAGNILKSLTALSQVIDALIKGKKHVPYKDSKLTRLLQTSLGGNCLTALLICASSHIYNRYETIRSLKFGLRCQQISNYIQLEQDDEEEQEQQHQQQNKSSKSRRNRMSVNINKPPLTLNDSKSLTLTLNDRNTSFKDNKLLALKDDISMELKDDKSLTLKDDKSNKMVITPHPDNEELLKQIEQLNIENDILRTKDELTQNITTLNETISRIIVQNSFKKNKNKKKRKKGKEYDITKNVENELNIFESKLLKITIGLNAKIEKMQELMDDGLSLCYKNDANQLLKSYSLNHSENNDDHHHENGEKNDNENDAEILVLDDIDSTDTIKVNMNQSIHDNDDGDDDNDDDDDGKLVMIKHKPNRNNLMHSINYNQKIYSETMVQELRRENEELSQKVNKLKLQQQNSQHSEYKLVKTPHSNLTPNNHKYNASELTPYTNNSNNRSPIIGFESVIHDIDDDDNEENDTYYICDDNEVYYNVYKNKNKPKLKINCNAKKMDNKCNNNNDDDDGTVIISNEDKSRNSGKQKVSLNLLRENQTLSEQLNIMQKLRRMDKDNLDLLQSPINLEKFDRSTVSPRDSITLLNKHLMQQLKLNRGSGSTSSSSSISTSSSYHNNNNNAHKLNPNITPTPSSARSSINSNSMLSATVESIDENVEKWNNNQHRLSVIELYKKRRSSANTINISTIPQSILSSPKDTDSLNTTPVSSDKTPKTLQQSRTRSLTYNDINFAEDEKKKKKQQEIHDNDIDDDDDIVDIQQKDVRILGEIRNKKLPNDDITKFMDDPILKEENEEDDDDESTDDQYDYSTDDDNTYYSNNFSNNDINNINNSQTVNTMNINPFYRTKTDSQIFRCEGMELSKKLKAKSVESPCQNNQRLSSTFAIHWINLKKH